MSSNTRKMLGRALTALAAVVLIALFYGRVFHANPTTVALTFLIVVLLVSAYWGFRLAAIVALAATAAFNFAFLPPVGTFTIADPQNWVALFAFLVTALVASNLAERARREAVVATQRRHEVERLYAFSQQLLTVDDALALLNRISSMIVETFGVSATSLWVASKETIYRSDPDAPFDMDQVKTVVARGEIVTVGEIAYVPIRTGVRSIGAVAITGQSLSRETLEAIGGLAGIAIERARALEQLTKTLANQENELLRSALLDSVTHEFRTPLTSIKASITSLLAGYELDETQRKELLTVIDEEADRLNRLVGQAAEMAQLDAQMFSLDKRPHPIRSVIQEALNTSRAVLQTHPVEVQVPEDLPPLPMDFMRMREVFMHLLENAAKYSDPGTPIRITAELKDDMVITSIADRGSGIDSFEQSLIFDKFYRGRNQRYAAHGTGMGLAISKVIVEAHGGTIGVISQLGSGSVFSVALPVQ